MADVLIDALPKIVILLFSLSIHEFAHAWVANYCGDDTARLSGRMTLNPVSHIDPVGTILFPFLGLFANVPVVGWAKPVPVNPLRLRNYRRDEILVSVAGVGANLIAALGGAVLIRIFGMFLEVGVGVNVIGVIQYLLINLMIVNVALAVFNLLPIPPLDGSHVLFHFLPAELAGSWQRLIQGNFFISLIILMLVLRLLPLGTMIDVPLRAFFVIAGI